MSSESTPAPTQSNETELVILANLQTALSNNDFSLTGVPALVTSLKHNISGRIYYLVWVTAGKPSTGDFNYGRTQFLNKSSTSVSLAQKQAIVAQVIVEVQNCNFCNKITLLNELVYTTTDGLWNVLVPTKSVAPGHIQLSTVRHVSRLDLLTSAESISLFNLIKSVASIFLSVYNSTEYLTVNRDDYVESARHLYIDIVPTTRQTVRTIGINLFSDRYTTTNGSDFNKIESTFLGLTSTPTSTQTPGSTSMQELTHTQKLTHIQEPTHTEGPTHTQEPRPTHTQGPTHTQEPRPTHTQGPTHTQEPRPTHTQGSTVSNTVTSQDVGNRDQFLARRNKLLGKN
jgi:diadenosine tetraphosphate (Ap4A) HIT family hydrolase